MYEDRSTEIELYNNVSGKTSFDLDHPEALSLLHIDEPTLQMEFLVNNSPFAGKEGKYLTSRRIEERLMKQLETDVSLRVDPTESPDAWVVSGRGELHLSILIENMRDRKSTRLNSSHVAISYAVFCLKKKTRKF